MKNSKLTPFSDKRGSFYDGDIMKDTIKMWYKELNFPKDFDKEFYNALENFEPLNLQPLDYEPKSGAENLMYFLYFCQGLEEKYKKLNIDRSVLLSTLRDLVYWTKVWSEIKGELYLGETHWLKNHMTMRLFTLGRLQFCFGKAECDIPKYDIKKDDNILEVHIPNGGRLDNEECEKSLSMAKIFFKKHFPQFKYKGFTCHSWLLASELKNMLESGSNIIKFQNMFDIVFEEESYDILKYVFRHDAVKENLYTFSADTAFAHKVKDRVEKGDALHVAYGVIKE